MMRKKKLISYMLVLLMLVILISISPIVYAGKTNYWLLTDEESYPESEYFEYADSLTESGTAERVAKFQWYVEKGTSRGGQLTDPDKPVGGTKAVLSMTGSGNDLILNIQIYKGGSKNPSGGPETYQWTITDGKDSDNDCINIDFTNSITGKLISSVSLYENDVVSIGLPHVFKFECTMVLS